MKKVSKVAKQKKDKIDIVLEIGHTHKGTGYAKGDIIKVNPSQADWLEENRVGFRKKPTPVSGSDNDSSGSAPDDI